MGNKIEYSKIQTDKSCLMYDDVIYSSVTDYIHDEGISVTKYYLPERNICFHVYENMLHIYSCKDMDCNKLKNIREKILSKKLYNRIVEIHKITELKKIKSVYIIEELKNL